MPNSGFPWMNWKIRPRVQLALRTALTSLTSVCRVSNTVMIGEVMFFEQLCTGDTTKLLMALLACLLGYGEVGLWLKKEAALLNTWVVTDGNIYKKWMDDYGGDTYQDAVKVGLGKGLTTSFF